MRALVAGLIASNILFCCSQYSVAQTNVPAGPKKLATNLKGFGIPFRINANDQSYIEVQLYLSEDQGKSWRFHDRKTTDKAEFPFTANADGEYWFALKTLNRNRQLLPEGKTQPELVILVDTIKPELTFQIESDPAGRVACRWRAFDAHLDPDSLQIFYQAAGSNPDAWSKVPVNLNGAVRNGLYADQVAWWPETTAQALNVRLTVSDTAGNLVQQDRRINVAPSPWRHRTESTARTGDANSSGQIGNQPAPNPSTDAIDFPNQEQSYPFPPANQTTNQTTGFRPSPPSNAISPPPYGAKADSHGNPNVICENGVCRLRTPADNVVPTANANTANQNQANALPRIADRGSPFDRGIQVPLIGGKPEYAAPPVPPGYVPPTHVASRPQNYQTQNPNSFSDAGRSQNWNSEPERWTIRNQSTSSSTLAPDPRMLPNPYLEKPANDQNLPAPNPGTSGTLRDRVIGESSTMGPSNQYRGLTPQNEAFVAPNIATGNPAQAAAPFGSAINQVEKLVQADRQNWQTGYGSEPTPKPRNDLNERSELGASWPPPAKGGATTEVDDFDSSLMMIGSKRFRLNYGIDAIDPSGVAKVDLWMTRDGGRNWTAWGNDPDNTSPFPVEVQEEGRYGFRIVVHSKDGLTGRGPSSGDAADIWVHVDTQSPMAQIVSVPYGRGEEAGRLVINYRVADPFLTLRPINIAYSRNPDGPWTPIGEGLRNEGRFLWKPTSNVPDRIFLRLDARDRAGNLGVHQLSQAIDVSGLVPRGTIHGVVPVGVQK